VRFVSWLPLRQRRLRWHATVAVAEVPAVVAVSMLAALTSLAPGFAAVAMAVADTAVVDSVAAASDLGLRLA
jgi:hypothetical protein